MQMPEFLEKKYIGPLKGWHIVAISLGGIALWMYLHKKQTVTPTASTSGGTSSPSSYVGGGGGSGNPPLACGPGTQPDPTGTFCIPVVSTIPNPPVTNPPVTNPPPPTQPTTNPSNAGISSFLNAFGLPYGMQPAPFVAGAPQAAAQTTGFSNPSGYNYGGYNQAFSLPANQKPFFNLSPVGWSNNIPVYQTLPQYSGAYAYPNGNPFGANAAPATFWGPPVASSTFGSGNNAFKIQGEYVGNPNNGGAIWVPI